MRPFLLILLGLTAFTGIGQTLVQQNINSLKARNNGPIIHNNQVTGYYFFYNLEKNDSKTNNYALVVTDENLKEVNTINIIRPRTFTILEAAFNGQAFAVLGYDMKSNSIEVISYDNSLKQIAAIIRIVRNQNMNSSYGSVVSGNEAEQDYLVPVTDRGFLFYTMTEKNKPFYRIEMLTNELKTVWTDEADGNIAVQIGMEGFQSRKYIGSLIESRLSRNDKDVIYELLINRTETGERVFRKPVVNKGWTLAVADIKYDTVNNEFVAFGEYYAGGDRETRDRSDGFMSIVFDSIGNVVKTTQSSWKQIGEKAPINSKGKVEGGNFSVNFHNTVRTSDGQMFVIGEQYRKTASGAGIALKVLATIGGTYSNTSSAQLEIEDMIIMQFNPDFSINRVHLFDKSKSKVLLPAGALTMSPKWVAQYGRAVGAFDYKFTQVTSDQNGFIVNYVDYDKTTSQNKFMIGSIVYTPEKVFSVDKFEATKKTQAFSIFKAKEGYILVTEYFRKEKKLESRLEKINY